MNFHLENRVAAVAGASSGLGFATAMVLAQERCRVAICGRNRESLEKAAKEITNKTNKEVLIIIADVGITKDARDFIEKTAKHFGQLDIVVANAGGPPSGKFIDFDENDWRKALEQNFLSTVTMFRTALPFVTKSDQGRLIAITSIAAKQPIDNLILSNASRVAVHGLVKTLSKEVASTGVTVNVVCPGITKTRRIEELAKQTAEREKISYEKTLAHWSDGIPMGRLADPMEFAAAVTFLCSKQAAFITGIALPVDGGWLAGVP